MRRMYDCIATVSNEHGDWKQDGAEKISAARLGGVMRVLVSGLFPVFIKTPNFIFYSLCRYALHI